jgi:hypothetical protein
MGHDIVATTWFSISGPAGLPKTITDKMNREIIRAVSKPEVQARLRQDGLVPETMSVDDLKNLILAESARWKPVRSFPTALKWSSYRSTLVTGWTTRTAPHCIPPCANRTRMLPLADWSTPRTS